MTDIAAQVRARLGSMLEGPPGLEYCGGCELDCYCQKCLPAVQALIAVLDATNPDRYPTGCECTPCNHDRVAKAIAEKLGIEAR